MQQTITENLLKHAAGRVIFCPSCGQVMDYRRTVIVEAKDAQGKHVATGVLCTRCYDKGKANLEAKAATLRFTFEVTDARLRYSTAREVR